MRSPAHDVVETTSDSRSGNTAGPLPGRARGRAARTRLALSLGLAVAVVGGLGLPGGAAAAPPRGVTCGDTITAPGHYYLIGNCKFSGISITASDVRLKLDGHSIRFGCCEGVIIFGSRVTVQGPGTIFDFDDGIVVGGNDNKIIDTTVVGNGSGISVFGRGDKIVHNTASNGSPPGIELFPGATDTKVIANTTNRDGIGILIDQGATANKIHGNTALGNATVDLEDDNPGCDSNEWSGNHFATSSNPSCIR